MNPEKNITPDIEQELPQNEPELLMPQPEIPTISPEELQKQEIEAEQNDKQELEITRRELGLDADQKPGETKPEKVEVAIPVEQTRAPEDITRRNFIGTTLKALGAFFIGSEITKGNETKEDRDPTDPKYREGVEALRGYAKKNGPEHACYYIKKTNGSTEWIDSGAKNPGSAVMDLSFIGEHNDYEEVEMFHNHPSSELPMAPSMTDIFSAMRTKNNFIDNPANLRFKVVDSFGTYEYIVDKAGDHLKEIVSMGKTQEKIEIEALEKDPDNAPKMADKMKELLQTMDPASAMIEFNKLALTGVFGKAAEQAALKIESLPISPETKKEIEKIGTQEIATAEIINLTRHKVESGPNTEEKSSKAWWKERTAIIEKARREQKHEIQKLMKLWKRNGVIINFTPHKN